MSFNRAGCCCGCGSVGPAIDVTLAGLDASVCADCVNVGGIPAVAWKMIALTMNGTYADIPLTSLGGGVAGYERTFTGLTLGSLEEWSWVAGACFELIRTFNFDTLYISVNYDCTELDGDDDPQVTQITVIASDSGVGAASNVPILAYNSIFDAGAPRYHNDTIANNDGAGGVACGVVTTVGISQQSFGVSAGSATTSNV